MVGPNSFSAGSNGGFVLMGSIAPGDYTMTWNDVDGRNTPAPETLTLTVDGTIDFHGVYTSSR